MTDQVRCSKCRSERIYGNLLAMGLWYCRDCGLNYTEWQQSIIDSQAAEIERVKGTAQKVFQEVEQTLGKALGYPWYKDDQKNFPGATEVDGVCVGAHVAQSIALEAAHKITRLTAAEDALREIAEKQPKYLSDTEMAPISHFKLGVIEALGMCATIAKRHLDKYKGGE